jgi:hypothetical protein
MSTVSSICDALGRREIAAAVGVKPAAVSNAVFQERFPAKWFIVVSEMCASAGIDCPSEIFAFTPAIDRDDQTENTERGAA